MVESLNSKVDLVVSGTSFSTMSNYGKIMVGNKGFEFYNSRNYNNFIQIPWEDVDYVIVSVLFNGRWLPRYALKTKKNGTYIFSSKETKKVLRAMREYVGANNIVKSLTFFEVMKRNIQNLIGMKKKNIC